MSAVVLLSGGLDSCVLLHHLVQQEEVALALSFDYGSKHNSKEIPCAKWQCKQLNVQHEVVELPFVNSLFQSSLLQSGGEIAAGRYDKQNLKATVVPFRNAVLLSIATGVAESRGAGAVAIAAHGGDHPIYPDCRATFMEPMAAAMRAGTDTQVELLRPFLSWSKEQIVRRGAELAVDFSCTWSCYRGGEVHCGVCSTCLERKEAFAAAQVVDPTSYEESETLLN